MNAITGMLRRSSKHPKRNIFERLKEEKPRTDEISLLSGQVKIELPRHGTVEVRFTSGLTVTDDGVHCVKTQNGHSEILEARASIRKGLFGRMRLEIRGDGGLERIYSDGTLKVRGGQARFTVHPDGTVRGLYREWHSHFDFPGDWTPTSSGNWTCWWPLKNARITANGSLAGSDNLSSLPGHWADTDYTVEPFIARNEIVGDGSARSESI